MARPTHLRFLNEKATAKDVLFLKINIYRKILQVLFKKARSALSWFLKLAVSCMLFWI